jgi:flagella basal body P-ring formation protein FlgA
VIFALLIISFLSAEISSETTCVVDRGGTAVEKNEAITAVAEDHLLKETPSETQERILEIAKVELSKQYDSNLYRFKLKSRWIPQSVLDLAPERIQTVEPTERIERYTTFEVRYQENNRLETSQIQLVIEIEKRLPVANRRIPSGETITEEMLGELWVPVSTSNGELVDHRDELIGFKVRRTLAPGQPVRAAEVTKRFLIRTGDVARLIFDEMGVQIEIEAIAQSSGEQDEEIIFFSEETNNRYLGRITGQGDAIWRKTL